jgi:hypothetical protein
MKKKKYTLLRLLGKKPCCILINIFVMIDLILLGFVLIKNCAKFLQSNSTGLDIGLVNHHSWSGFGFRMIY